MSGGDIKLGIQLVFDGKAAGGEINISREQFRALASEAKRAGEAVSGGFSSAAKGVRSVSEMMAQARNLTAGIFGMRELAQASDAWTNLASRMALVAPTAKEVATTTQAIANAVRISGGTAESTSAALLQLGQALASGTLRGEELNSVMEQTPALAEAIARGMGKTIGDLRKMGEAGQLAAGEVLAAINKEAQRLETDVGNRIAADPGIHARARKGDSGARALLDEYATIIAARAEIKKNLETLRAGYRDIGTAAQEAFTKNEAFMTKAAKQTDVLAKAGEAYTKAWLAAANGPPEQIGARRAEAYAQFQGFIAETLDYKGTAEARADALVAAAKSSAARVGKEFKHALDHYMMSSDDFIRKMAALEKSTLDAEQTSSSPKESCAYRSCP